MGVEVIIDHGPFEPGSGAPVKMEAGARHLRRAFGIENLHAFPDLPVGPDGKIRAYGRPHLPDLRVGLIVHPFGHTGVWDIRNGQERF
ncbi:hypothetical protein SDC9_138109 [bioreactor metagenome]|uniref:Uncharacterized protein n=1 Tax=bioreactor metagenome TaxID=1076179 RepID=A0A645DNE4_9ZZZZ